MLGITILLCLSLWFFYEKLSYPTLEQLPFFFVREPEFHVSYTSIELTNYEINRPGILFFYIIESDYELELSKIISSNSSQLRQHYGPILDSKREILFDNLKINTTYIISYFARSEVDQICTNVYTKALTTLTTPKYNQNEEHILFKLMVLLILLLLVLLVYCLYKNLQSKNDTIPSVLDRIFNIAEYRARVLGSNAKSEALSMEEKARRLRLTQKILGYEYQIRERQQRLLCLVCCTNPREVMFLDCGHLSCCEGCTAQITKCPYDRKSIGKKLSVSFTSSKKIAPPIMTDYIREEDLQNFSIAQLIELKNTLKAKFITLREFLLCKLCKKEDRNALFYPCRHIRCCLSCSKIMEKCPIDFREIEKVYEVFIT